MPTHKRWQALQMSVWVTVCQHNLLNKVVAYAREFPAEKWGLLGFIYAFGFLAMFIGSFTSGGRTGSATCVTVAQWASLVWCLCTASRKAERSTFWACLQSWEVSSRQSTFCTGNSPRSLKKAGSSFQCVERQGMLICSLPWFWKALQLLWSFWVPLSPPRLGPLGDRVSRPAHHMSSVMAFS